MVNKDNKARIIRMARATTNIIGRSLDRTKMEVVSTRDVFPGHCYKSGQKGHKEAECPSPEAGKRKANGGGNSQYQ